MPLLSENSNDRVMLFMDLQNILRSVESIGTLKLDLDFYAMAVQLAGTRHLVGMYTSTPGSPGAWRTASRGCMTSSVTWASDRA